MTKVYDVFLSHHSTDKPAVRKLAERLASDGLQVWFDEWIVHAGDDILLKIEEGLEASRVLVLVMSPNTFGSDWINLERSTSLFRDPANRERRFVPFLLCECNIPDVLRRFKYIDYRNEEERAYRELLAACQVEKRGPELADRIVDLGDAANFDLDEFDRCLEALLLSSGLVGVSVAISPGSSRNFPSYLQRRLQGVLAHLSEGEIFVPPPVSLKATLGSVDVFVQDLIPYKLRLKTSDILLTVRADDEGRLKRFWDKLASAFGTPFEYCFIVLIVKESEFNPPPAIEHDFPPPEFHRGHVVKWVVSLTERLPGNRATKRKLISDWTEAIMQGCAHNQKLYTDRVYDHIEMALNRLQKRRSIGDLYQFFEEWKQLYAQTPP